MFGRPAARETWAQDREVAVRLACLEPPWGHGVDAAVFADVPTLVVTGGWNEEYEAIASRLVDEGAEHLRLPDTRHRPQTTPPSRPKCLRSDYGHWSAGGDVPGPRHRRVAGCGAGSSSAGSRDVGRVGWLGLVDRCGAGAVASVVVAVR